MRFDPLYTPESPPVARLPQAGISLTRRAEEMVEASAALVKLADASLVSIALTPRELAGASAVVLFDRRLTGHAVGSRGGEFGRPVAQLKIAAAALFKELSPRWPAYAPPPQLGVISDGHGLGLSPQDPWPLAPDWLARQVQGQSSLTEIIAFGSRSRWSMLTRPAIGRRQ